jgi:exosortase B
VVAGLLLLYVPTYRDLASVFWESSRGSQGPLILVAWFWLLWRERAAFALESRTAHASAVGWALIGFGALLYVLGRSQGIFQVEVGSQLALLPGILLVLRGAACVRRLWFVLFFLIFLVPLHGSLIDSLLVPLKALVSAAVTQVLFHAGLPVARDGVVIYAGNYQLFIAEACSGLNSIVALTAVGAVYVHVAAHREPARNVLLLAAILPVAILANLLRVMGLVLATYFGGDRLGQQLHDYAGYMEIAVAFGSFFLIDCAIRARGKRR